MLKLQWIEIFLRAIPEMLLMIWGICVVARKTINTKIYIFSSIIMGITCFFVRKLPIYFGVHMFIIIILTICTVSIIGIPIIQSIYGTLLMGLLLSLSEFLNVGILSAVNGSINIQLLNPIIKSMAGFPSLIITYLFIKIIRYYIKTQQELKKITP